MVGHGDEGHFVTATYLTIGDSFFAKPGQTRLRLVTLHGTRAVRTRTLPCTVGGAPIDAHRLVCLEALPKSSFRDVIVTEATGHAVAMPKNCQPVAFIANARRLVCSKLVRANGLELPSSTLETVSTTTGRVLHVLARGVLSAVASPDRKQVAILTTKRKLKLLTIATRRSRAIATRDPVWGMAWSPDRRRLAITTTANRFGFHRRITIRTLATGAQKRLPVVGVNSVEWMNSGRLLFTFSPTFSTFNVDSVRANGTGIVQLTHLASLPPDQFGFIALGAVWTPDFKHLAIETDAFDDATNADIRVGYAVNPTGGGFHVLAEGRLRVTTIGPDGLVYGSTDTAFRQDEDPTPVDVIRVGFAPGAKPQVLMRHAIKPAFVFG
jgi:hypothetical protein